MNTCYSFFFLFFFFKEVLYDFSHHEDSSFTEEIVPTLASTVKWDCENNLSKTAGLLVVPGILKGGIGGRATVDRPPAVEPTPV